MDMKSKHKTRGALFMYINYPFLYMVYYMCCHSWGNPTCGASLIIFSKIHYRLKILFYVLCFSNPNLPFLMFD